MNIAELFVRVRGDTSDVTSKLAGVQRSMAGLEGASKSGTLHLGKLGNSFEALASRIAGVNPVVGKLAGVLGDFSIGAATTVGVLAGVAAVAVVYDKLTESSRKAMEAGDKLAITYNQLAKISALGIGGQQLADIETINKGVEQHAKWLSVIVGLRAQLGSMGGLLSGIQGGHSDQITAGTAAAKAAEQQRVNAIGLQNAKDNEAFAARVKAANEKAAADAKKAEEAAQRYRDMMLRAYGPDAPIRGPRAGWVSSPQSMTDDERAALMAANGPPGSVPSVDISDSVKIANDQAKKINDEAERHAQLVKDAIWGSAAALANSIVGALNIGGGGKGSNLGGALGGTAGFALGFAFGGGPIGGAIGSTIGNIMGSLVGGLFDHKKAIDTNTAAVRQMTAALLLNSPSGYKVGSARFDATQTIKEFQRDAIRYATRGGAPVMLRP